MFDLHKAGRNARPCCAPCSTWDYAARRLPTVTGKTLAENTGTRSQHLRPSRNSSCGPGTSRCTESGHIKILRGNLAPEGAVAKTAGLKVRKITGPARVFDGEEACFEAVQAREIKAGDVIVIRGEGPVGGPGCAKCWPSPPPLSDRAFPTPSA